MQIQVGLSLVRSMVSSCFLLQPMAIVWSFSVNCFGQRQCKPKTMDSSLTRGWAKLSGSTRRRKKLKGLLPSRSLCHVWWWCSLVQTHYLSTKDILEIWISFSSLLNIWKKNTLYERDWLSKNYKVWRMGTPSLSFFSINTKEIWTQECTPATLKNHGKGVPWVPMTNWDVKTCCPKQRPMASVTWWFCWEMLGWSVHILTQVIYNTGARVKKHKAIERQKKKQMAHLIFCSHNLCWFERAWFVKFYFKNGCNSLLQHFCLTTRCFLSCENYI